MITLSKRQYQKVFTCDVIDDHGYSGITDVAWNEASKALLACSIPELETHLHNERAHRLAKEHRSDDRMIVNTVRSSRYIVLERKSMPIVAW